MGSPEGGGQAGPNPSDPGHTPSNRVPTLRACWSGDRPTRHVSATLEARLTGAQRLEQQLALRQLPGLEVDERLSALLDGKPVEPLEVVTDHGNRVHVLDGADGQLSVSYTASAVGRAEPVELTEADRVTYSRPSRYAESDRLLGSRTGSSTPRCHGGARAGRVVVGGVAAVLRAGQQRADRRGDRHPDDRRRRVPRLRAPRGGAAAGAGRPGPAGRGVRARLRPDGLPRRDRGGGRRTLARPRRHLPGASAVDAADQHRSRRG